MPGFDSTSQRVDLQLALGSLSHVRAQIALASIESPRPQTAPPKPNLEAEPAAARTPRNDLTRFFLALSAETRRRVLYLLEVRERSASEITSHFELSQPTMSRHLSILKKAHLIADRRVGRRVFYRLSGETLAREAVAFFSNFRDADGGCDR